MASKPVLISAGGRADTHHFTTPQFWGFFDTDTTWPEVLKSVKVLTMCERRLVRKNHLFLHAPYRLDPSVPYGSHQASCWADIQDLTCPACVFALTSYLRGE